MSIFAQLTVIAYNTRYNGLFIVERQMENYALPERVRSTYIYTVLKEYG